VADVSRSGEGRAGYSRHPKRRARPRRLGACRLPALAWENPGAAPLALHLSKGCFFSLNVHPTRAANQIEVAWLTLPGLEMVPGRACL
jgi:hypothetical protein